MALIDLADRVKQFITGEVNTAKKNESFDSIEKVTGIKIDDKQRAAMIKANVPVDQLMTAFTLKQIQSASSNPRGSQGINQLQQPGGFEQIQSQMPGGGSISQGGVTATIPESPRIEEEKARIQSEKEIATTAGKASKETDTNLISADLKFDSIVDSFIDYSDRQKEITGLDPGPLSGAIANVINSTTRMNEFQNALQGASLEIAAASAKSALPTMRGGVEIVKLFSKGVLSPFDTIESGVVDSSKALKSVLMQDMAASPDNYIPGYSKLDTEGKVKARKKLSSMANQFDEDYKKRFFNMALKKQITSGREILKPETTQKLISTIPNFKSIEEGESSVESGDFFIVNGQLVEAS